MAEYYLISQLPCLDGLGENSPVPITEARFLELCERFLGKKAQNEIKKLTLLPPITPIKSSSAVVNAFSEGERNLRLALARVRAEKMKKTFDTENESFSVELMKVVNAAVEMESPMAAEQFLSDYRLKFLESIRPTDAFSQEFLFYYGLKLKLILHKRQFDAKLGEAEYKNIYDSILNGDRLEAI